LGLGLGFGLEGRGVVLDDHAVVHAEHGAVGHVPPGGGQVWVWGWGWGSGSGSGWGGVRLGWE
jgi:hypothetical protein